MKKHLKLRVTKFDKIIVVEVLESQGLTSTTHVLIDVEGGLAADSVRIPSLVCKTVAPTERGIEEHAMPPAAIKIFSTNLERDAYERKMANWISSECFGVHRELKVGEPCMCFNSIAQDEPKVLGRLIAKLPDGFTPKYIVDLPGIATEAPNWKAFYYVEPYASADCFFTNNENSHIYEWYEDETEKRKEQQ